MRSRPSSHTRTRAQRGLFNREGIRALIAAASLAGIFMLVFFMTTTVRHSDYEPGKKFFGKNAFLPNTKQGETLTAASRQEPSAHRVGSIVFAQDSAETCEEWRFDNFTGAIVGAANVDCDARISHPEGAISDPKFGRMQGILDGFKK